MLTRLATLGPARLSRGATPGPGPVGGQRSAPGGSEPAPVSPADLVRPLLQHLADLAADAQGRRRRAVPVLADRAVGDQLAVLAAEVLDPAEPGGAGGAPPVPLAGDQLDDLASRLAALRRALP